MASKGRHFLLESKSDMQMFEAQFESNTLQMHRPFLIVSFRAWCPACQRIQPEWKSQILPRILLENSIDVYEVHDDPKLVDGNLADAILSSTKYVPAFVKAKQTGPKTFTVATLEGLPVTSDSIASFAR